MSISLILPLQLGSVSPSSFSDSELTEAIKQNLRFLLLTRQGEYIMDPRFGVGVSNFLFEMSNDKTLMDIESKIRTQVSLYMPYIQISNMDISYFEEGVGVQISISFLYNRGTLPETFTIVVS